MAADERPAIIRELDTTGRELASKAARMDVLFRALMVTDDPDMPPADVLAADQALQEVLRALPELRRVLAKRARHLDGPPPELLIRAGDEPEHLAIIARAPSGDLAVGNATRTGVDSWRIRLTDPDTGAIRSSISLTAARVDDLQAAVSQHMDDHGPWWSAPGVPGGC